MARSDFGSSGFGVPPTQRVGEISFDQGERERRERRRRQSARPQSATLIDLLFEEIEPVEDRQGEKRDAPRKRRSRPRPDMASTESQRSTVSQLPPDDHHPDLHPQPPHEPDEDTDRRVRLASERAEEQVRFDEKVREARQVSTQLRYCLCQHTETARMVSSYLHALLMINYSSYKPTLVIEV